MLISAIAASLVCGQQDPLAEYKAKLIPIGKPLPGFTLKLAKGGSLSLSQAIKGRKATLVNFWFYG
ncbi:MAG: hypothetical protein JNM34_11760 [Chthonomonadaceae bacterium]|jgi:hypothetical protein|nr:hypothetical protein [Chthonomonadaceae bacterium]